MSRDLLHRRRFLTLTLGLPGVLPLTSALLPPPPVLGARRPGPGPYPSDIRRTAYRVDVALLYDAFTFQLDGTLEEWLDPDAGRYGVTAVGQGPRAGNRLEAEGRLIGHRWSPVRSASFVEVAGRQTRTEVRYDHDRRTIYYQYRGETFLRRRPRAVDDVVPIPDGVHVDDLSSAVLNFSEGRWPATGDGFYRTHVVRRQRPGKEGPDDVSGPYRAELVAVAFRTEPDPETGRPSARFDISGFTGWARDDRPARIVFGADRRPAVITASLVLGTSVTIRLRPVA
jgi:hypothetical protein